MSLNSGRPYTPAEDAMIRDLPRVPGAVKALAAELGRTRVAIFMRRSELEGKVKKKDRDYSQEHKRPKAEPRKPIPVPLARPAWFDEPNIAGALVARRGI